MCVENHSLQNKLHKALFEEWNISKVHQSGKKGLDRIWSGMEIFLEGCG